MTTLNDKNDIKKKADETITTTGQIKINQHMNTRATTLQTKEVIDIKILGQDKTIQWLWYMSPVLEFSFLQIFGIQSKKTDYVAPDINKTQQYLFITVYNFKSNCLEF